VLRRRDCHDPPSERDALKAELRRLQRIVGSDTAKARIQADRESGGPAHVFTA